LGLFALGLAALAAATFAGRGSVAAQTSSATQQEPSILQQVTAHEWYFDRDGSSILPFVRAPISLVFDASGVVSGSGPCNSYRGPFVIDGSTIRIGPVTQSFRACDAQDQTAQRQYLVALQNVRHAEATSPDQLQLTGASSTRLAYISTRPPQLPGQSWEHDWVVWFSIAMGFSVLLVLVYLLIRKPWSHPR
jgi:heat shock protein HslJ